MYTSLDTTRTLSSFNLSCRRDQIHKNICNTVLSKTTGRFIKSCIKVRKSEGVTNCLGEVGERHSGDKFQLDFEGCDIETGEG